MRGLHGWRRRTLAGTGILTLVASAAIGVVALPGRAGAAGPTLGPGQVRLTPVASGLSEPIALAWRAGDSRMYVAERTGSVAIVNTNHTVVPTRVVTGLASVRNGEQGLLGLAFSPDGTKLYVDHTDTNGDILITEFTMNGDVANVASRRDLLTIPHPTYTNHYGGELIFGPDGNLYIGTGDGGGGGDPDGNAQDLNVLLGKILRIDPHPNGGTPYSIPAGNPFAGQAGKRAEIWMYGLRNPWRFSFDQTGRMWIADVGQNQYEEVDVAAAGQGGTNWGWPRREGLHAYSSAAAPGAQSPLFDENHDDGWCAVIGGYVYHGTAIPSLAGAYVFGDLCRSGIVGVVASGRVVTQQRTIGDSIGQLVSFGQDPSGELYTVDGGGSVYKLIEGTPPRTTTTKPRVPPASKPAGYSVAAADGRVFGYGTAPACAAGKPTVVGIAASPTGYWTTTRTGSVVACRSAQFGSLLPGLAQPVVGIAALPSGKGYWLVAADGGVFSLGGARFYGSTGNVRLAQPVVGMTATPSGKGYWFVASDGGVFAYGDARFFGSTGNVRLAKPVVGMTATPTGKGYWLVAADGGVFAFGDAQFFGSTGNVRLAQPVVGMAATPSGKGYWFVASDGGVFAFGDARYAGSAVGAHTRIVGIAHN